MRPNRLFHTSSFRLTLLYAGLFTASVLILFAVTYWSAVDYAAADESSEIDGEFAAIQDEARLAGEDRLSTIIDNHLRQRKDVRAVYLLEDASGHKLVGNVDAMAATPGARILDVFLDGAMREVRAHGYLLGNGDFLLIGQDTHILHEMEELIVRAFGVGLAVTLLLAIFGGAIISTNMLGRVEVVSRTARAIVGGDLTQRVPVRGTHDEFDDLAESVNEMLNRIEDLMRSMRQVSNDIAHDLRTPLTRLRQRLEHARRPASSEKELRDALGASIGQVDAILETFGALLRIAQIEAGGRVVPLAPIDVSSLLSGIVDDFAPAAEDHGQRLVAAVSEGLIVIGDRELLTQMVVNLVDNAIRHSPAGATIRVEGRLMGKEFELAVADTGPGIPPDERENVLRPFYRLESSRTTEGSGLGLSLVAAIAKWHRAALSLSDNRPGLRVALRFPTSV